jgi:hypothetical protein
VTINPFYNPLVAARLDAPPGAWSGVWIVEDIELIEQGAKDGSWIETSLGVVGASLDTLGLIVDPIGTLLQYAAAWVIEHVKPLSEALDWLAGDPAQIAAHARTWRNVAAMLREDVAQLTSAQRDELPDWSGTAAQAYQAWAAEQRGALNGLAKGADAMATITQCAGFLIGAVRVLVRDLIATAVSRLIVYAGEELLTAGVATPVVVAQVTNLVASCAAKISRWLQALLASLRRLMAMVRRLGELITDLKRILGRLRGGTEGAEAAREAVARDTHFFHPDADPLRVHGNAFETHPAEVEAMIKEARELGVEINWRSDGGLAYGPAPSAGRPGVLVIDRDASYGAWLHEFNHMRDDAAAGWPGMRGWFEDSAKQIANEQRAYEAEIRYAESIGDTASAARLRELLQNEIRRIMGE